MENAFTALKGTSPHSPERATRRFFESADPTGLRFVDWADQRVRLRHTGWYADNHGDETFRGAIFRLPAVRGRERFVAGYGESMSDGFVLELSETWDDPIGAGNEADRQAERAAEEAREYEACEAAKARVDEIAEDLKHVRSEILALCRSMREACPSIGHYRPIREALRGTLQAHLQNSAELVDERERLREDFRYIVPA